MSKLRADCSRCCGLCCVVPDQLAVQGFGADKPAETPCAYLDSRFCCTIHTTRPIRGYPACEAFDCFGTGQYVTEHLFEGARWTDSPELADAMFAAYRHWLPRFRTAALIEAALPYLCDEARDRLMARMTELVRTDSAEKLTEPDAHRLHAETLTLIRDAWKTR